MYADVLSRMPSKIEEIMQSCTSEISPDSLQATVTALSVGNNDLAPWIMCLPATTDPTGVDQQITHQD